MSDNLWLGHGGRKGGLWILYDGDGREWAWWLIRMVWCLVLVVPFSAVPWPSAGPRLFSWLTNPGHILLAVLVVLIFWRGVRWAAEAFLEAVRKQGWRRVKASRAYWYVAAFFLPFLFLFQFAHTLLGWKGWLFFQAFQIALLLAFMLLLELFVGLRRTSEGREAAEDAAQRSRLEPHFLFNVLNDIQAQIPTDPSAAASALGRVGHLMRSVLALTEQPLVPLEQELDFVESYLGLQKLRMGSRLRVTVEVPEEAEPLLVPTLSLHTLVENALKHGLARRPEGGELRIWARVELRYEAFKTFSDLIIGVDNDAAEATVQPSSPGTGTGLSSLRARLQMPEDLRVEMHGKRFRATLKWRQP